MSLLNLHITFLAATAEEYFFNSLQNERIKSGIKDLESIAPMRGNVIFFSNFFFWVWGTPSPLYPHYENKSFFSSKSRGKLSVWSYSFKFQNNLNSISVTVYNKIYSNTMKFQSFFLFYMQEIDFSRKVFQVYLIVVDKFSHQYIFGPTPIFFTLCFIKKRNFNEILFFWYTNQT